MLILRCQCGKDVRVRETQAGKTYSCPSCRRQIPVPSGSPGYSPPGQPQPQQYLTPPQELTPVYAEPLRTAAPAPRNETPSQPSQPRFGSGGSSLLPWIAIAIALVSAGINFWMLSGLGWGLGVYDLSTPEESLRSDLEMRINADLRAQHELERLQEDVNDTLQEKLDSLKVSKELSDKGKKILLISFEKNGVKKRDVEAFEKDADSGLWIPITLERGDIEDNDVARTIDNWLNPETVPPPLPRAGGTD